MRRQYLASALAGSMRDFKFAGAIGLAWRASGPATVIPVDGRSACRSAAKAQAPIGHCRSTCRKND